MTRKLARAVALAAPLLALTLGGCTTVGNLMSRWSGHKPAPQLQARAAPTGASERPTALPADRLYAAAARSIQRRDYAEALDILQIARERTPDDARVLNALGVVYDKLGRFDLSERYYALAARAEPDSPIVAANLRYSSMLQAAQRSPAPLLAQAAPSAPVRLADLGATSEARALPSTPPLIRRVIPAGVVQRATPALAGGRLNLVNASGRALTPTRLYLTSAGWTLAQADQTAAPQDRSEIRFDARIEPVAQALARTLPFKVTMAACASACPFQLVLGRDAPPTLALKGGHS
ncbi:LytR C-terminal domain-containing protein [Phenylobacterium sp.]|uniref:LytR C-terminal domain-containing protein n=1 Tax=Phenylobacterium sp. TaxID=1871053 RepID=UPI002737A537|nr:LytR C-terminal domain-containing protein [Phenylobacterium sp.]MDP3869330.1 tetratricopeptide repeat protein [Phenylobacterium sp.]